MNKEQQSSDQTKTTILVPEYTPFETKLTEFKDKYESIVVDVSTTKGMEAAKASRKELRDSYLNLKDLKAKIKAPVLERGRLIDSEYNRIDAELKKLFAKFDQPIKDEEAKKKAAKEKKEREKREALLALQNEIANIQSVSSSLIGSSSEAIEQSLAELRALDIDSDKFGDLAVDAIKAKQTSISQLETMIQQAKHAKAMEAENKRIRAEQERRQRIDGLLSRLRNAPSSAFGKTSDKIAETIEGVKNFDMDQFGESRAEAETIRTSVISQLETLLAQTKEQEAKQAEFDKQQQEFNKRQREEAAKREADEKAKREQEEKERRESLAEAQKESVEARKNEVKRDIIQSLVERGLTEKAGEAMFEMLLNGEIPHVTVNL
ncbi:DUF1351 domain-containing protein [Vibrio phage vB_VpP_1]|nr:DUF1351 domain-containing protein [Vibrio phage vB_VpP_1]